MTYQLDGYADVLRSFGLNVVEEPGWRDRGHDDMGTVRGVLCHHTGCGEGTGDDPTLELVIKGRNLGKPNELVGPLCNILLARSGTLHMIAAGRAYHAGPGEWQGITYGNTAFVGIEAENNGTIEAWTEIELDAYARCCAAILLHIQQPAIMCAGHKEYALPKGRKIDPDFDMDAFRRRVANLMDDGA